MTGSKRMLGVNELSNISEIGEIGEIEEEEDMSGKSGIRKIEKKMERKMERDDEEQLPINVSKLNYGGMKQDLSFHYDENESDRNKNVQKSSIEDMLDQKEKEEQKYMTQQKRKESIKIDMSDREENDIKRDVIKPNMFIGKDIHVKSQTSSVLTLAQKMQKERDEEKETEDKKKKKLFS